jgi:1,2-diacylglycerol 3-beta-galactosyltransferase
MLNNQQRVLILTADAGFGHRSAANALKSALEENMGVDVYVDIINPLDLKQAPFYLRDSQAGYDRWVREVPELYRFGYEVSDALVPITILESILIVGLYDVIKDILIDFQPDIVISTYPLYLAPLEAVLTILKTDIPIITVVTDLATVHSVWFNRAVHTCIVPNETVQDLALRSGLVEKQILVAGIPVHPQIEHITESKAEIRQELGWQLNRLAILVVGSKRVEHFMESVFVLNHAGFEIQLVMVSGKDQDLYNELMKEEWHVPAFCYEFVDQMPKFLKAADLIISKAGGLIVTESLASGLPLLLIDVIPGQETGNALFVEENQAGFIVNNGLGILEKVCHFIQYDATLLKEYQKNARAIGKPNAAAQIAEYIKEQLSGNKENTKRIQTRSQKIVELLTRHHVNWEK